MTDSMKGIELMVLDYLAEHPRSLKADVIKGTGCTSVSVSSALISLKKKGLIGGEHIGIKSSMAYFVIAPYDKSMVCVVDICGKHYKLTGEQIQKLRRKADKYQLKNREKVN